MRHAMGIDLDRCVGCQACVSACKEQWDSGPGAARDWVHTFETGTRGKDLAVTFYPGLCMQCETHPCTADCPTGATYVDPRTGVVVVDPDVCIGCGSCVPGCPYGVRHVDPEKRIVEKCNLCAPFVARGELPACVKTCPAECRVFGDLDDPESPVSRLVRERGAQPLAAPGIDVRPRTVYAGDAARARILAQGVVQAPERSGLAAAFGVTLPLTRTAVPAMSAAAIAGGLLVNWKARADRVRREEAAPAAAAPVPPAPAAAPAPLPRHRLGMRVLHWFNAASWVLLLVTGVGLMAAPSFAFFGTGAPRAIASWVGGADALLRLHVFWGVVWAAVIVPGFLAFKRGLREVWHEVRITRDDLAWLALKPLAMAGLRRQPLPPQDKYNGGQKIFALFVLVATATIIASGVVMIAHVGSAEAVSAAVLVHKLAIALVVVGVAVHVTMAAVIAEERPALRAMIGGTIDHGHAAHHSPKWVAALSGERPDAAPAAGEEEKTS